MKRNFASKATCAIVLLTHVMIFTSCSSIIRDQESVLSQSNQPTMVPKEQYDELARKYQELLNHSKNQAVASPSQEAPKVEENKEVAKGESQVKPEVGATTNIDPSDLVNRIDQSLPDSAPKSDTVDAFANDVKTEKKSGPPIPSSMAVEQLNTTDDIDEQIIQLRQVQDLIKVNKFENALTLLKELENSKEKQIVVRAKVMLGDLLFNQGEYDLASQVYEEIIKKYSFSGFVLKSLGRLVACSEKLKQPEKQAKYYSLLHDFFEAG